VWRGKRGISLDISLVWKAGRLCSPFPRRYTPLPFGSGGGTGGPHSLRLIRRIDSKKKEEKKRSNINKT